MWQYIVSTVAHFVGLMSFVFMRFLGKFDKCYADTAQSATAQCEAILINFTWLKWMGQERVSLWFYLTEIHHIWGKYITLFLHKTFKVCHLPQNCLFYYVMLENILFFGKPASDKLCHSGFDRNAYSLGVNNRQNSTLWQQNTIQERTHRRGSRNSVGGKKQEIKIVAFSWNLFLGSG